MVLGTAVHASLELFYRAIMEGGEEPNIDDMVAIAHESIDKAAKGNTPLQYEDGLGRHELDTEACRIIEAFMDSPYRPHKVLGVEVPFGVAVVDPQSGNALFEELVVGFLDLLVQDEDGSVAIVDHKVTGRLAVPKSTELDIQLSLYGWAGDELFGAGTPVELRHHVLVRGKQAVRIKVVDIPRSPNDAAEAFGSVCAGLELISMIVEHPRPKLLLGRNRSWRCSGCAYQQRCSQPDENA
tara:strand:- start:344 stop:1063 length:720 start_codon:yes stop_codon:yes gene_type:complete